MKKLHVIFLTFVCFSLISSCNSKVEKPSEKQINLEEDDIRKISKTFVESYNSGNSQQFDPLWTMDAFYQNPVTGEEFDGREMITLMYGKKFNQGVQGQVEILESEVKSIDPNKAFERGIMQVTKSDKSTSKKGFEIGYIKKDGVWMINDLRELNLDSVQRSLKTNK